VGTRRRYSSALGGLIGFASTGATDSYATGAVTGAGSDLVRVVGGDDSGSALSDACWDTPTSGNSQGAGNTANDTGLTGLTNRQLHAGLPDGFEPSI